MDIIVIVYLLGFLFTAFYRVKEFEEKRIEHEQLYNFYPALRYKGPIFKIINRVWSDLWIDLLWPYYWYKKLKKMRSK